MDLTDRGLSGFHGTHRTKGALGRFLAKVESGGIPSGSILLVENIDRLSREGAVATLREVIFKLWDHGITIATLSPEELYEPNCDNNPKFMALFIYMQRAQDESQQKSMRIRASREKAREAARNENKLLTAQLPAWIDSERAKRDGQRIAVAEAVETIRLIFELKRDGVSQERIESRLNAEASWGRKNGWRVSYIKRILTNRAVIGEYQPHKKVNGRRVPVGEPIPGYFPVIVEPELFHLVQQKLRQNHGKGGRTGKAKNLFTHIVTCAYCGGPMRYIDKGKPPKGAEYLVCDNGVRGVKCSRHSIRYDEFTSLVLENCTKLDPIQILPNPDEQSRTCDSLRRRIQGQEAEIHEMEIQIENYVSQIGRSKSATVAKRCEDRVVGMESRKAEIAALVAQNEYELREAEKGLVSFRKWKQNLKTLLNAVHEENAVELRLKLKAHLRDLISNIEIFAAGPEIDDFVQRMEGLAQDFFPEKLDDPQFYRFAEHFSELRMTKRGRFVRVHFKSGAKVDLVPEGSLADGMKLVQDGSRSSWRFVSPNLDQLWREFATDV